ncbi:MAG: hypothetical protein Kow0074_12330 [Candidatus Zixiibacteriota bacterium]
MQEHYPSISRERGWQEVPADIYSHSPVVDKLTGRRVVLVELDYEGRANLRKLGEATRRTIVATLTFRGKTIRFTHRDQIPVLRDYITSKLREPHRFPGYELSLRNIPTILLRRVNRQSVVTQLERLLLQV